MSAQVCNEPAKRECISKKFGERDLDALVVIETKLEQRGKLKLGNVSERVSGVGTRRAREGVSFLTSEERRRKLKK